MAGGKKFALRFSQTTCTRVSRQRSVNRRSLASRRYVTETLHPSAGKECSSPTGGTSSTLLKFGFAGSVRVCHRSSLFSVQMSLFVLWLRIEALKTGGLRLVLETPLGSCFWDKNFKLII
uniref:Uncharacterized protein n=1 Tax=Brassica oleracea TaxID=3712 RepID=A0A3P6DTB5_BRAOL|nr:unnamed protein product [Brassica oleracea]